MIPVLFPQYATTFTSNGLGRLSDCTSCKVTEARNGEFECEFEYPISGIHYADIKEGLLVVVDHDDTGDLQPFEIYAHTAPIDGIVTFYARHISYRLANVILKPLTASSASSAFSKFETETLTAQPFTFWTDISTAAEFKLNHPASVRSVLGGVEGSILDVYGGEYEFDKFTVKLHAERGSDNDVEIRYAKNLSDLEQDYDIGSLYTAIIPYWTSMETGETVYGNAIAGRGGVKYTHPWTDENDTHITDENGDDITFSYYPDKAVAMDFSQQFQTQPTVAQLEQAAAAYLRNNTPWIPKESIEVDFVALWQTEEYKNIAPLERVKLCDTVRIIYTALGVDATAKVIRTEWNALTERYNKIELGEARTSFADTIMQATAKELTDRPTYSMMEQAINQATELIRGGTGGHVVFGLDADGKPNEIFIMDTEDVNTAVNVLRINMNGIGFSKTGIEGTYDTAWTLDGSFVADFITAGTLNANRIRTGTIASADGSSYWDLDGSVLRFYDKRFDSCVELDEGYIKFGHGDSQFGKLLRMISNDEDVFVICGADYQTAISLKDYLALEAKASINVSSGADVNVYSNGHVYISAEDYFWIKATSAITMSGQSASITGADNIQLLSGANDRSKIRIYDDGTYLFIDLNSGGNTWVRIDGNEGDIRIQSSTLTVNGYEGYNGSVNISGTTLNIHNGIITSVS